MVPINLDIETRVWPPLECSPADMSGLGSMVKLQPENELSGELDKRVVASAASPGRGAMKVIVVGGTQSGVGKTSIAVGLMAAYKRRGLRVQPFKVGPDFLDPMHHRAATGRDSLNLDGWMLDRDTNLSCFLRCVPDTDIAIVEGVMGLFDGRDGKTESGSTAEMAKIIGAPVVLVLDCWALARSAAAIIHGYTTFDPALTFAGVIFNKVGSDAHTTWLKDAVEAADVSASVLGGVPKVPELVLPERHLGLHMPGDEGVPADYIERLADLLEKHVDLDAILHLAGMAEARTPTSTDASSNESDSPTLSPTAVMPPLLPSPGRTVRIGVARDAAFCFYYHENLALLQAAGAQLVYFSPLTDALPTRIDGLYFGGGYPELHAPQLASNARMLYAIRAFAAAGGIIYGECGGLMYLSQGLETAGERYPMCGVFPFWTRMVQKMMMGYVKVAPRDNCVLFPAHLKELRGQVYHFSEVIEEDSQGEPTTPRGLPLPVEQAYTVSLQYPGVEPILEGYQIGNVLASYVHIHFGSNTGAATSFVEKCKEDNSKAAAVAAASASAVAASGAEAAAAAGAAAAAAVHAALNQSDASTLVKFEPSTPPLKSPSKSPPSAPIVTEIHDNQTRSPGGYSSWDWARKESDSGALYRVDSAPMSRGNSLDLSREKNIHRVPSIDGFANGGLRMSPLSARRRRGSSEGSSDGGYLRTSAEMDDEGGGSDSSDDYGPPSTSGRYHRLSPRQSMDGRSEWRGSGNGPMTVYGNQRRLPVKIVSLLPHATEILMHLGVGDRLIGISDLCDFPPGLQTRGRHIVCRSKIDSSKMSSKEVDAKLRALKEGKESLFELDVDWLAHEQPDLVVTQDTCRICDVDKSEVARALSMAGLLDGETEVLVLDPRTMADVFASILKLGDAVGASATARALVEQLRTRLRGVAASVAGAIHRPRVLSLEGLHPLVLGGHWLPEMKILAGGLDGLQEPGCNAERLQWERVIKYDPEVIVLVPCSSNPDRSLSEVEYVAALPGFWNLTAVQNRQVFICEHSFFSRPGPRLVLGVEILARILHPKHVPEKAPPGAVLKLNMPPNQKCRPEDVRKYFERYQ